MAYEDLLNCLRSAGVPLSPAECHGSLCGLLCSGGRDRAIAWMEEMLLAATGTAPEVNGLRAALLAITDALAAELYDPLIGSFQPLVPDDEHDLAFRTGALAQWSESFLGGLGLGGIDAPDALSDEAKEALTDLAEIAKLEDDESDSEELEVALAEVHEYVRVVMQLLCTELAEHASEGGPSGPTRGATVH